MPQLRELHAWSGNCHPRSRLGLACRVKESTFKNKDESNHGLQEDNEDKAVEQDRDSDARAPERPLPDLVVSDLTLPAMVHLCSKLLFSLLSGFAMLFCSL